jgi:ubiquinone/menaquinone biosynthesis C-methylase UbiE
MSPEHRRSEECFRQTWNQRKADEMLYLHWTREEPKNQIQLAFRQHWKLFQEIISEEPPKGKKCIELGAGRGTISMYFADAGWDCTILDVSDAVLEHSRQVFQKHGLSAKLVVADAMHTGLPDDFYDVCVSIGLLEHLPDLKAALQEQVRLLSAGGILLAYVVPHRECGVQKGWQWLNDILRIYYELATRPAPKSLEKPEIYRSDARTCDYVQLLEEMPICDVKASGVYPLPMLSPSIHFPFTLNSPEVEQRLVEHFRELLDQRAKATGRNPWLCPEEYGQAFLVWGRKK